MQKLAGLFMVLGFAMFAYGENAAATTFEFGNQTLIQANPGGWTLGMGVWIVGSIAAAVAVTLLAAHARKLSEDQHAHLMSMIGPAALWLGTIAWAIVNVNRISTQTFELSSGLSLVERIYTILVQIGVVATGYMLLRSGYPKWIAILNLVLGGLMLAFWLVVGDGPPAFGMFVFLFSGLGLLIMRTRQPTDTTEAQAKTAAQSA